MQNKAKILPLTILLILFIGLGSYLVLQGQVARETSIPTPKPEPTKNPIDELKKDYPGVDYSDARPVDSERLKRSEKYGRYSVLNPDVTQNDQETSFLDWASGLPALPIKESEIIVIGKIVDAQAYLSANKNSVYSEFTLEIEKQFKNTSQQFSPENKTLKAEREGGIVRYPSGFETFYFVSGQRMPKMSKTYLFFLTSQFPLYGYKKNDLYLITAYELVDGKVIPLDNPGGGTHKIATFYRGKDETVLLDDVHNAINKNPKDN